MIIARDKMCTAFSLVELMVAICVVAILAAAAIPILRGRINQAKWSEGRAIMGSIATSIRAYQGQKGPIGPSPTTFFSGDTGLLFALGDLTGTYFVDADFSFSVTSMDPLTFTVTCTPTMVTLDPPSYVLDQSGTWSIP